MTLCGGGGGGDERTGVFCVSESDKADAKGEVGSSAVGASGVRGPWSLPKNESRGLKRGVVSEGLRAGNE